MRAVLLALLLLALTASSAAATGTLTIDGTGTGTVSGDGISCTITNGVESGDCAELYTDEQDCDPERKPPCFTIDASFAVTASAASGFAFDRWSASSDACADSTSTTCSGNIGANLTVRPVFRDSQAPSIDFGGPPAGKRAGTLNFFTSPSDNVGVTKVEFRLNGVLIGGQPDTSAPYAVSLDTTTLAEGPTYTVTQQAFDAAGNGSTTVGRQYTFDNSINGGFGPNTPAEGSTVTVQPVPLDYTTDADATATCRVDGAGDFGTCASSYALGDGVHNYEVRFTDDAGNSKTVARTFKVDRTAPTLTVSAPTGFVNATTITPATASDDGPLGSTPTLTCKLDAGAFGSCIDIPVSEGAHTLRVRSTDTVGNFREVDTAFTVDRTLPEIAVTPRGGGNVLEVEWTASDASPLTFACKLDSGEFATCASGVQYSGLKAGSHSVTVRATDAAGNSRSQTRTFVINAEGDVTTTPGTTTPPTTGGAALPTRPKVTAPSKLALKKAKRKLLVTVATTVPGCRLRLLKGARVYVSRKIVKAGTTKLTITLDRRVKPGTYVLTLKCASKTAKRRLKLTA